MKILAHMTLRYNGRLFLGFFGYSIIAFSTAVYDALFRYRYCFRIIFVLFVRFAIYDISVCALRCHLQTVIFITITLLS